jgi:hypothetical protein
MHCIIHVLLCVQRWLDETLQPPIRTACKSIFRISPLTIGLAMDRDYYLSLRHRYEPEAHLLREDLATMLPNRSIPIALVKANVCRLLEYRLTEDGFNPSSRPEA